MILFRFLTQVKKVTNEQKVLRIEFENRYRDRLTYLQKASFLKAKDYFALGFEKLLFSRKLIALLGFHRGVSHFVSPFSSSPYLLVALFRAKDCESAGDRRDSAVTQRDR